AGRAHRHRHRPRRHALLSPRRHHRRRRGTRRRNDREARRTVRRARGRRCAGRPPAAPPPRRVTRLRRRFVWSGAGLAALLLAAAIAWAAEGLHTSAAPTHIAVDATPITSFDNRDPTRVRFGALEFRGGLVLTSDYKAFGGVSALHMETDGAHFVAVTDNGSWLKARIVYDGNGKPASIADAEMAPALGSDGTPLAAHGWHDLESLAAGGDGEFYVGIERVERIVRFDLRKSGFTARGTPVKVPPDFKTFKYNKSLE